MSIVAQYHYSQSVSDNPNTTGVAHDSGWVEMVASTPADSNFILLSMLGNTSADGSVYEVDLALGADTAEVMKVEKMLLPVADTATNYKCTYGLPMAIPSGSRITLRSNTLYGTGGGSTYATITLHDDGISAGYSNMDKIGGGALTCGNGTKGSQLELTASTSNSYEQVMIGVSKTSTSFTGNEHVYVDVITGASNIVIPDYNIVAIDGIHTTSMLPSPIFPLGIASSTRVAVQGEADLGADEFYVSVWGFR